MLQIHFAVRKGVFVVIKILNEKNLKSYNHLSLVTRKAPDFIAEAVYPDNSISQLNLQNYIGKKYICLFFYPLDFTFVCPSEIIAFHQACKDFESRDTQIIGISVDSQFSHLAWRKTPLNQGGIGKIDFPLVSDITKSISKDYGVLINDAVALRGLFIIDKSGIVRHQLVNDLPLGRSVPEALRIIDALQYMEKHGEVCPANWKAGLKAMIPSTAGVAEYLSSLK